MAELINPNPIVHERRATHRTKHPRTDTAGPDAAPTSLSSLAPHDGGPHPPTSTTTTDNLTSATASLAYAAEREPIDSLEIFEHIRDIADPEHPYSLEQLNVVSEEGIQVDDAKGRVSVRFTPTVAHCSMATLIGLSLRVKLLRCLPPRFKVDIQLTPGSHSSEAAVNKQLSDKERVAAALENPNLAAMVNKCLAGIEPEAGAAA